MSKRQATIWRNKLADYESTNPGAEIFTETEFDTYNNQFVWSVTVVPGDGTHYHLYTAQECKMWINDAY
jgi:hypothetical protein